MEHLDDADVLMAGARGAEALPAEGRAHLSSCPECTGLVTGSARLAAALREADPEPTPPSFDALVAPALAEERATAPAPSAEPAPSATASWRLTAALVLRQARLVPRMVWPLYALGFAALFAAVAWAPTPEIGATLLGPGVTLLVTLGALAACGPSGDPRAELMYTLRVPPLAVWLARLALVFGGSLAAATGVSFATAVWTGSPGTAPLLMVSWLGPALLGVAFTVFGTVWRSPAVGATLGTGSWLMSVLAERAPASEAAPVARFGDTIGAVWSTSAPGLAVAALLLAGAAWLVTRPGRTLPQE